MNATPAPVFAEDVNYWRTSTIHHETWIEKAKREITKIGGKVISEGYLSDAAIGSSMFALNFKLGNDSYRAAWPVLKARGGDQVAAKRQAATLLFHDVKHKCVMAKVKGARAAFVEYLILPSGQTATEATSAELMRALPLLLPVPRLEVK